MFFDINIYRGAYHALECRRIPVTTGTDEAAERALAEGLRAGLCRVPFYKKKFDEKGIKPSDIKDVQDIAKLPFTKKSDLRDNYPYGLFAEPLDNIVRIHASSGTTGKPTVVAYNRNDINLWAEVMARTFTCAGVTNKDVVQNAYGYGLFTGGLGAHYGAERVGASVIPISGGNTQKQIMLLQDFGSTAICCTPSFALYIYDVACEMKINLDTIKLRVGLFGAEPWTEEMRHEVEERLRIKAIDIYGLSEIIGPGVRRNASRRRAASTSTRTTSIPRSSTPRRANCCPTARKASS